MKKIFRALVMILLVITTSVIFTKKISAQQPSVSFQVFYDQLSPYGEWVDYPNYGYVWIPDAGPDFVPYSSQGHWIFTDYGWTWMSDYSWGWAPFHYGRWDFDNYYGWFWVPDNQWGPAWVSWRRAEGYYGWAPMEPGISLSVSFGRGYDSRNDHWIFVRDRDIDRDDINHYYLGRTDQNRIVRYSSVVNNTYVDNRRHTTYVTGPDREDIQKVTGRRVNPVSIQESNRPGQDLSNGRFSIYRPEVAKNNSKESRPAPSRITNLKDVKQPSERTGTNKPRELNVKSTQPAQKDPSQNTRRDVQPNNINTQNTNAPKNINREAQPNNVKKQESTAPQNIRREAQPDNVKKQESAPPQNIRREAPPNNVKRLESTPPENIKRNVQPVNIKKQESTPPQNIKREAQPNNVKRQESTPPQNIKKEQQSTTSKSSRNSKKEQQKKSNDVKDLKENK